MDGVEEYAVNLIGGDYDTMLQNAATIFFMKSAVPYAFAASWDRSVAFSRPPDNGVMQKHNMGLSLRAIRQTGLGYIFLSPWHFGGAP